MKPLADLQAAFAGALRDPALPVPADIRRPAGARQTRRFDVYRNNFTVSLIEALETTFPAVRKLVGGEFFRAAARVFIAVTPPRSPILLLYGREFGDFLESFEPARTVPYLGDVARLEWARLKAYHASDEIPVAIDSLGAVDPGRVGEVTFDLHPSLSLVSSRWPVVSLWSATTGAAPQARVDMARPEVALVVRPALTVEVRTIADGGGSFLSSLMAGGTLGAAAQAGTDACDRFDLGTHISGLFAIGAVTQIRAPYPEQG